MTPCGGKGNCRSDGKYWQPAPSSVHWRRFYFQLTRLHSASELFGRCALQIYLLTYLVFCVFLLGICEFAYSTSVMLLFHSEWWIAKTKKWSYIHLSSARYHATVYYDSSCTFSVKLPVTISNLRSASQHYLTVPRYRLSTLGRRAFSVVRHHFSSFSSMTSWQAQLITIQNTEVTM